MKKIGILLVLALAGCLQTTTHRIEMKRKPGDIWWRDREVAPVTTASVAPITTPISDEDYFNERVIRWPDDWRSRRFMPANPTLPAPKPPEQQPSRPQGELY